MIKREVVIFCDGCMNWHRFYEKNGIEGRKDLKKRGWTVRNKKDLCLRCRMLAENPFVELPESFGEKPKILKDESS